MRNLKVILEYEGGNYAGWQTQTNTENTIQQRLQETLQIILQERPKLIASGRTDKGVHALGQVINFKIKSKIPLSSLKKALNSLLPAQIRIKEIKQVALDFHARFDATSKVYRYLVLNQKKICPFCHNYLYYFPYPLDIKLMQAEAKDLLGRHDFRAFQASGSETKNTVRTIRKFSINSKKTNCRLGISCRIVSFEIEADGFLYKMVRNIVGTFLQIGRKRFPKGTIKKILYSKDRRLTGPVVPAKGLYLLKVNY